MDWWLLRQLRARVMTDLAGLIPVDIFENPIHKLNDGFRNSKFLSRELGWGIKAGQLGRELFFEPVQIMTPRQVAASEMLMHLGMLAAIQASNKACIQISELAAKHSKSDGNAGIISAKIADEIIPTFHNNIRDGLSRYLPHLPTEEAKLFNSLLINDPDSPVGDYSGT